VLTASHGCREGPLRKRESMRGRVNKAARTSLACLLVCVLLISPGTGRAQGVTEECTDLSEVLVRGGHYYTRTNDVFTWVDAADLAQRIGGYLVVPDTSWENAWVVEQGWGDSWIGIYDPSESTAWCSGSESLCPTNPGRFRTSRGAIPRYANWETGQPDNRVFAEDTEFGRPRVDPLGEHWAVIGRNGRWGDMGNHNVMYQNPVLYRAVIEFESAPACYQPDPGGGPVEGDICELGWTEEYQDETVRSRPESIVPCLRDLKGRSYCPEDLVPCSKVREEDPGTRVERTGVRTEEAECSEEEGCECESDAYVLDEDSETCRATYTYYTFECPEGRNQDDQAWAGPREPGGDCGGPLDCPYEPPPPDNCTRYRWVCPVSPELGRNCAWFGGEDWRCSSHICYNAESGEDTDTPSGVYDKKDDGWQQDGECAGEVYIFNGKDMRCKHYDFTWGVVTMPVGWSSISWMLIDWDGCCTNDRSGLNLFPCKPEEKVLQQKREKDLCVSVGSYCAQTLNLGFTEICLRKKKTFCCFSSKLARVVQEQARTQLYTLNTWGTPEGPVCRGLTPEEFQMIDWGKIDLSEFEAEIKEQTSGEVTDRMKEKLEGFYSEHF